MDQDKTNSREYLPAQIDSNLKENPPMRSENITEIMGRPPKWMIRWGISLISAIVIILFIGCYFIRYPDVISARIIVHSQNMPAHIISNISGRIDSIFVNENQRVCPNDDLVYLHNICPYSDYQKLISEWTYYQKTCSNTDSIRAFNFTSNLQLGELQTAYEKLLKSYKDFLQFENRRFNHKKIQALKLKIQKLKRITVPSDLQLPSCKRQTAIACETYDSDSLLYTTGARSTTELNQAKQNLPFDKQDIDNMRNTSESQVISILLYEQEISDIEQEMAEQRKLFQLNYSNDKDTFFTLLHQWEGDYFLKSPIAGNVCLSSFTQTGQNVNRGETLLTIIPDNAEKLIGKIYLPLHKVGKVKVGQSVNLKFDQFPYLEYGAVRVKIRNISRVPIQHEEQSVYFIDVFFPDGLLTNYGKTLPFSQNMEGIAEIITEDLRLLDKFLNPIRAVLKQ